MAFVDAFTTNPGTVGSFLDPTERSERAVSLLRRMSEHAAERRAAGGAGLEIEEVRLDDKGQRATVLIRGLDQPLRQEWVQHGGEWYLQVPRPDLRRKGGLLEKALRGKKS